MVLQDPGLLSLMQPVLAKETTFCLIDQPSFDLFQPGLGLPWVCREKSGRTSQFYLEAFEVPFPIQEAALIQGIPLSNWKRGTVVRIEVQ